MGEELEERREVRRERVEAALRRRFSAKLDILSTISGALETCRDHLGDLPDTVASIAKLNRRLEQIDELAARIKEASDEFGENLAERVLDAAERGAGWKEDMDELAFKLAERRADLEEIIRRIRAREASLRDRSSAPYHRSLRLLRAHPSASAKEFGEVLETLKKLGKG